MHLVTAIGAGPCPGTSCTLTFDDPLTTAFRRSGPISFTGAISGTTLTTSGDPCTMVTGQLVESASTTGTQVSAGTYTSAVNSCSGGVGNYTVNNSQTVSSQAMLGAGHQAMVYPGLYLSGGSTVGPLKYAGVENLSMSRSNQGTVEMSGCVYCWIRNIDAYYWDGGGLTTVFSARSEVSGNFIHHDGHSTNSGGEYGLQLASGSTEILMTNNIDLYSGKGTVSLAAGGGSVVSYNYIDDTMYDSTSGIGDQWLETAANPAHASGTHHILFEGNWSDNFDSDKTHGNTTYVTVFRNYSSGLRTPFIDPSSGVNSMPSGATVNDFTGVGWKCQGACFSDGSTKPGPLRALGPMAYNYWFSFVGNVLGTPLETTAAHGWSYQGDWSQSRIWMLGWNDNVGGEDPYLDGVTASYIFRNGNYDYVGGPSYGSPGIYDWQGGYSNPLPNSFYLASQPSFFGSGTNCTYPWPWVTPTGSSPLQMPTGGSCAATTAGDGLPAKARWDAGTPFVQP